MAVNQNNESNQGSSNGYVPVNGLMMYYEIHGTGAPMVLIHGGGSTIHTSFGRILGALAKSRQVIGIDLQGHGRTAYIDRPETFEQDADDVAAVMKYLHIDNASIFGFSNGGNTAMQLAIRHPQVVHKLIVASSLYKRDGMHPQFWEGMGQATLANMPQQLKDAYNEVAPDPNHLVGMFDQDKNRMLAFTDWKAADLQSINAPVLIISGDQDVIRPEHAVEMYRLFPHAQLAILPGTHGEYMGEIAAKHDPGLIAATTLLIEKFLDEPMPSFG